MKNINYAIKISKVQKKLETIQEDGRSDKVNQNNSIDIDNLNENNSRNIQS